MIWNILGNKIAPQGENNAKPYFFLRYLGGIIDDPQNLVIYTIFVWLATRKIAGRRTPSSRPFSRRPALVGNTVIGYFRNDGVEVLKDYSWPMDNLRDGIDISCNNGPISCSATAIGVKLRNLLVDIIFGLLKFE